MSKPNLGLALHALALPFLQWPTFLRCSVLPFAIWIAFAGLLSLTPTTEGQSTLPGYVQVLGLSWMAFAFVSLVAFSINWRRSLDPTTSQRDAAPFLAIDARTVAYIFSEFLYSRGADARGERSVGWIKTLINVFATLLLSALFLVAVAASIVAVLFLLGPYPRILHVLLILVACCWFIPMFYRPNGWQQRSAIALDLQPESLPIIEKHSIAPAFLPLAVTSILLFSALSLFLPLSASGTMQAGITILTVAAWAAAVLLTTAWFAAAETLLAISNPASPSTVEPLALRPGSGHRRYRQGVSNLKPTSPL